MKHREKLAKFTYKYRGKFSGYEYNKQEQIAARIH